MTRASCAFLLRAYGDISRGVISGWDVVRDNAWVVYLAALLLLALGR